MPARASMEVATSHWLAIDDAKVKSGQKASVEEI